MFLKDPVRKPRQAEHASPARSLALKAMHFSANGIAAPLFEKMLSVFVNQAFGIPMARGDLACGIHDAGDAASGCRHAVFSAASRD